MGHRTPPPERSNASSRLVTERDLEVLAFAAQHRLVLAAHVQALLGVGESIARRRLAGLARRELLDHTRLLHGQPGWYQITRTGLALIGSELPPPRLDLRSYGHDIGVGWLWLAASRGDLGRVERIVSEREMRSRDAAHTLGAAREHGAEPGRDLETPFGVRLGGVGPGGRPRLHYPDLLLVGPGGERVAIELELSTKGHRRLETILAGYAADPTVTAVLYLAESASIRRQVTAAASRLGISEIVRVQRFSWHPAARPIRAAERTRQPAARAAPARAPRDPAGRQPAARAAPARASRDPRVLAR